MDNDQIILRTDAVDDLLQLLKRSFKDEFKSYYEGDPLAIPKDSLPAIIVEKAAMIVRPDATGTDKNESEIVIKVVLNKADDFNKTDEADLTERRLRRLVEGIDKTTNTYAKGTLLNVLRTNLQLGGSALKLEIDVNYDVAMRADMMMTSEALISVNTVERFIRPNIQSVN